MSVTASQDLTRLFNATAAKLATDKIFYARERVKELNVPSQFFDMARKFIGTDVDTIGIELDQIRLYIVENWGVKAFKYFETELGDIEIDHEHALFFYYALLAQRAPSAPKALGLAYYLAGHLLEDELNLLRKNAPKNLITPSFKYNSKVFGWDRCPFILRKYMLDFSVPDTYKGYTFERGGVTHLAYLVNGGMPIVEAKNLLQGLTGGIFFTFLPPAVESALLPRLLDGSFKTSLMDGIYTSEFQRAKMEISKVTYNKVYNVFNEHIRPTMVEMTSVFLRELTVALENARFQISPDDVIVYHVSPYRIGVAFKRGFNPSELSPELAQYLQPVKEFNVESYVYGDLF